MTREERRKKFLDSHTVNGLVRCTYCRWDVPRVHATVDHIVPISRGGSNRVTNYKPSCGPCNTRKSSSHVWAFAEWLRTDRGALWLERREMPSGSVSPGPAPFVVPEFVVPESETASARSKVLRVTIAQMVMQDRAISRRKGGRKKGFVIE